MRTRIETRRPFRQTNASVPLVAVALLSFQCAMHWCAHTDTQTMNSPLAGLYAAGLPPCSSIRSKFQVSVKCKQALGADSQCFGQAATPPPTTTPVPILSPPSDVISPISIASPPSSPVSDSPFVVKFAVSLPMTKDEFDTDRQTQFRQVFVNLLSWEACFSERVRDSVL